MKNITLIFAVFLDFFAQAQEANQAINVKVTGDGDPIIFIPGFTVPGESWDSTILQLQKEYECHVVTLAGFGGKAPIDFPWLPTVNQALEDYINEKKLIDVAIIGHSLGGTIAAWLASRENNKISEIILIDALPATGALVFPNFKLSGLKL
ncbi:MAG: alpha/beta hydrolase, partial [Bacteroidota bacterium]